VQVFVGADILRSALERALLVTEDKLGGNYRPFIKLEFEGNTLKMSSVSSGGSFYDEIPVSKTGEDMVIAFNCRLLVEALRYMPESVTQLRLGLNNPLMGMTVEEAAGSGCGSYVPGCQRQAGDDFADVFLDFIMPTRMNK
jgi:DNA polymerase-3 subunit beta